MPDPACLNTNLVCLQKAVLCANCEVISEGLNARCGACGSQALLRLSPLVGGTIEEEPSFHLAARHANNEVVRLLQLSAAA